MRNVSLKGCRENQNTHFMIKNISSENFAVYDTVWNNIVHSDRPHMSVYVLRQKSNETGNAVHEPTKLLLPPSHGS